ncbi:MAG TPA: DUF106 domain-containing protein [Nanoarchaeota archaeon]|nr:DUF106 domain-containing protein [Nanoarchaeota archaeon]
MAITSLMLQNPLLSISLISIILALATTLIYKYATDQSMLKQIREDTKKYQEQLKTHKGDPQKMLEIQNQMMPLQSKMMMQSFKPMLITIIPFIIIFKLLGDVYTTLIVIPLSFWPGHLGWIGVYVIVSMIFTTIFRKALKVV